jgi:asparagine N-glycosylation enzyme membrane subunit Stt3
MPDDIREVTPGRSAFITPKRLFMSFVLVLGFLFLFVFWQQSQNGRYTFYYDGHQLVVFDTRTGELSLPKDASEH